jgi:hypothetical protein
MAMSAFEKIAAGLNDAIAYADGDTTRACVRSCIRNRNSRRIALKKRSSSSRINFQR